MELKNINEEKIDDFMFEMRKFFREEMPYELKDAFIHNLLYDKNTDSGFIEWIRDSFNKREFKSEALLALKNIWINKPDKHMPLENTPEYYDVFWYRGEQYQLITNLLNADSPITVESIHYYKKGMKNTACSWNSGIYFNEY